LQRGERFDVILCDLMMPEMTGMDLHAALQDLAADQAAKMAFMTGGAFSRDASDFFNRISNPRIEKPFKASTLRTLVQGLIRPGG
jgi:CheY-like chemotaxis protein